MKYKPKHPWAVFLGENMLYVWLGVTMGFFDGQSAMGFFWLLLGYALVELRTAFTNRRAKIEALERLL